MEEIGIVKSVNGTTARVMVERKSACEHCEKDTCDITESGIETEAVNAAGAAVGQKVKVVMRSYTYLKAALLLYVLPVFALFSGAIFGKVYLPDTFKAINTDLLSAIGGFSFLIISLMVVKVLSMRMNKNTEYRSVIEEIIE